MARPLNSADWSHLQAWFTERADEINLKATSTRTGLSMSKLRSYLIYQPDSPYYRNGSADDLQLLSTHFRERFGYRSAHSALQGVKALRDALATAEAIANVAAAH